MKALHKYVICYDYGMGGLWATMLADSVAEIHTVYPELEVYSAPPEWMSDHEFRRYLAKPLLDLHGPADGILKVLVEDRRTSGGVLP